MVPSGAGRGAGALLPQEELHRALVRPVLTPARHPVLRDAHRSGGERQGSKLIPPSPRRCTPGVRLRPARRGLSEAGPREALRDARTSAVVGCRRHVDQLQATGDERAPRHRGQRGEVAILDLHRRARRRPCFVVASGPTVSVPGVLVLDRSRCSGCSRRSPTRVHALEERGSAAGRPAGVGRSSRLESVHSVPASSASETFPPAVERHRDQRRALQDVRLAREPTRTARRIAGTGLDDVERHLALGNAHARGP